MTQGAGETPLLELEQVECTFSVGGDFFSRPRQLAAVDGVSLRIPRGSVLGLVGESGCGKTTLARLLLGIHRHSGGSIRFDGQELSTLSRSQRAERIQPVFQDPYSSLNPRKRVQQIVALPLELRGGHSRGQIDAKVDEMLESVGLDPNYRRSFPVHLSGGQRQRVAIARALIARPQIVVCDEPTSALDVSIQAQIINLLIDLRQRFSLTYVFISHNLAVVEHLATTVAVMYLGRIVEVADTRSIFASPQHPYTRALLDSVLVPRVGRGLPESRLGTAYPNPLDPPSGCRFHPRCPQAMSICAEVSPEIREVNGCQVACHLFDGDIRQDPARNEVQNVQA